MVEPQPSKLAMRVRSPSPAPVGLIPVEGTTLSSQRGCELPGGSQALQYFPEFWLQLCECMVQGEHISAQAEEFSLSVSTLQKWRRQARVDAGREAGLSSGGVDPRCEARRRVKELEAELIVVKAANALLAEGGADPKERSRLSEV